MAKDHALDEEDATFLAGINFLRATQQYYAEMHAAAYEAGHTPDEPADPSEEGNSNE